MSQSYLDHPHQQGLRQTAKISDYLSPSPISGTPLVDVAPFPGRLIPSPPQPKIYAYTTAEHKDALWRDGQGRGLLKVGYTSRANVEDRIREQFPVRMPTQPWELLVVENAVGEHGAFRDGQVHQVLVDMGRRRVEGEWFECTADDVKAAVKQVREGKPAAAERQLDFPMRPEQRAAVSQTAAYLRAHSKERDGRAPHFLWNAKMRFGKTFTAYQLAKEMGWKRVLVLTFKPAVQGPWREDLEGHVDFADWQFLGKGERANDVDPERPLVWFASFQDVLGRDADGETKERLRPLMEMEWDAVYLDEYHFGAWREGAKEFIDPEERAEEALREKDADELDAEAASKEFSEEAFSSTLKVNNYIYLSGTPFRAIASGEFLEDQVFSWTYGQEQTAKEIWDDPNEPNPYLELPTMVLLTYKLPEELRRIAQETDLDEFDLNEFFAAEKVTADDGTVIYRFKHPDDVQKWLDLLRGQYLPYDTRLTDRNDEPPPIPFEDRRLLATLQHTLWYLPSVAACNAMKALIEERQNSFYQDYKIIVAAGPEAGIGLEALGPVEEKIGPLPLETKTITLSCGKLLTGVTVKPWTGIFMLQNTSSPETYFQAAFRVQSPWTKRVLDPMSGEVTHVLKDRCYVFDFAPNRALRLVAEYATEIDPRPGVSSDQKVADALRYLPVLCYDGYSMQQLNAADVLDFIATGTASTALARRWESARLLDLSSEALERLLSEEELVARLERFEAFRNLSRDLTQTINAERAIKKLKMEKGGDLTPKEKKEVSEAEKATRALRKKLLENLKKFTARVPVFMYLTDYREETLVDVIKRQEPDLFKKVTNLELGDFQALCDIGIFNPTTMDAAVFAFRRFEDASLHYAGGGKVNEAFGGWDSYATREDVVTGRV